jgi:hypothetical protein
MMNKFSLLFLVLLGVFSHIRGQDIVYSNQTLTGCSYSATCTSGGYNGVCVSISAGCCSGTTTSNLCPGSSDIKCCTQNKCSTPSGSGTCMQTSKCSSSGGTSFSGYCVGPSDLQCCVTGGGGSSEYGIDVSSTISSSSASCFKSSGIKFVIPRGYKSTGAVDTQVCTSIKAAATAGISKREAYLFPCPTCSKSASTQVGELVDHLKGNCDGKWTGRIWLDIEGSQYWLGSTSSNQNWYKVSLRISCYIFLYHLLPVFFFLALSPSLSP